MAMLLNQCTLFIGLLLFFPWEPICFTWSYSLFDIPLQSCILTMTSHNFQHILSWEVNNTGTIPSHYTVSYTVMSAVEEWKAVESCTNITKSSCNMTDIYETHETYLANVTGFNGKEKLVECVNSFFPITDTILDPPEVSIYGFKDSINVTVHHPATLSQIKNKEKELFSVVVIKVQSSNTLNKDLTVEMDDRENITTIIDSLIPNSNYCVSAHWDLQFSNNLMQSPLQCIMLSSSQESGSEKIAIISFTTSFSIFLIIILVTILKKTGYICRKQIPSPKGLDFSTVIHRPLQLPYVKITRVDIIYKTKKKKMFNDSDDKNDSDCESTQRIENNYTVNGFTCRSQSQDSKFCWKEYNSTESDPDETESAEVDPPLSDTESATSYQLKTGPDKSRVRHIWNHLSEGNTFSSRSDDCCNFNVNLSSVFVGDCGDDKGPEEDATQILLPVQEDKINLVDSDGTELQHITHATCVKTSLFHVPSKESLCSENSSSDESVSSESDVDLGDGYIRR
ncbi:interleukin-10 receptor subunit beta isoform X1 [Petaurus breviceps papuanus]|uniref:interleukin-10 receptor subunit beta isoform X1 n=1 Tax=Petaurus breviceps papuanus TaxID=3040969 RepID=UPI0036D918ED